MRTRLNRSVSSLALGGLAVALALATSQPARAHCDTLDGPVVAAARAALDRADIAPVLKWVQPAAEPEVRAAFDHALKVRTLGPEARTLADRYFFETLVRVHRAGEGAPYTGLSSAAPDPIIRMTDQALASGSVDELVRAIAGVTADGIRERFAHARATRVHAEDSVAAGREYVAAYVELTHYVERLQVSATTPVAHGEGAAAHAHR